ncbi:MAG: MFS transporter [Proteobacteria bacterium]|nr:MFS transporter [Pseudomonadota bacterium]
MKNRCIKHWVKDYRDYFQPKMVAIFFWAFASGIPLFLVATTLSARLLQEGFSLEKIGFFSLAALPYTLKFIGSPFIERFSIPVLTRYVGHARAWMLVAMSGTILSLIVVANIDIHGGKNVYELFSAVFCAMLFCAINDIAEPELRIGLLDSHELALGTACYTNGYCLGELMGSGGALMLAGLYGWESAYLMITSLMFLGIISISLKKHNARLAISNDAADDQKELFSFRSIKNLFESIVKAVKSLLEFPAFYWIFSTVILYYASYYISFMMQNPFYIQAGFSITQIGALKGIPGGCLLILGGILGGPLCKRYGVTKILFICAIFYMMNIFLQAELASLANGHDFQHRKKIMEFIFGFTILFNSFMDGLSVVGYVTIIASLSNSSYVTTQYALLTSLLALSRILFSSIGGYLAELLKWIQFFILNGLFMIPVLFLIIKIHKMNPNFKREETSYEDNSSFVG